MNYDVIVLGAGPGGYVAAIRAAQLGLKVAVVEREALGGICLNWGCIPTKALLKSAQVFGYIQHAEEYGISVAGAQAEFGNIIKRSRGVAEGMSKGVDFLMRKNKIETIFGNGKLTAANEIEVTGKEGAKRYTAKHIIIATGGRARELPNMPIDGERIIEYRKAMSLPVQPKKMIVVGAGAIGMEFAYFYNTLGTEVTVIEYFDAILPREDADVSKELLKIYKKEGMDIRIGHAVEAVEKTATGCKVTVKENKTGKAEVLECDVVLSAAGVTANIEGIGLEALGIEMDKGKIKVDAFYKTNIAGVYAIGDVTPGPALAHVASAEGIICVEAIAGHHPEPLDYGNIPSCTYCIPEVASVGMTEAEAKAAGHELKIGKFPFSASGKASASGAKQGFVKVIYDAKYGELLGAHLIGMNVTEMIAELVTARKLETTGHEILKAVHPHPTMSEAIMEATAAAYGEVIHL